MGIRIIIEEVSGGYLVHVYDKSSVIETDKRIFTDAKEMINFIDLYIHSDLKQPQPEA